MATNVNRLECKLKEIILDSRDGHSDNYSKSLTEDHLFGSAQGKNAFTLDDPAYGTTIFMPWKLHRPLESTFNKHSDNFLMPQATFKSFVDNFGLFPKFQNTRKKDDILDYILEQANKSKGPLNFEEFLLALFLLSKYRASVLHTNEQYAFNILLNSILKNSLNLTEQNHDFNLDLGNLNQGSNNLSSKSSKNFDGVIYHDSGLIIDTNIGKVYESPRKLETKDFTEKLDSIRKEESIEFAKRLENSYRQVTGDFSPGNNPSKPTANGFVNEHGHCTRPPVSSANNSGSFDADVIKNLLDVLRDQNLLNDSRALHDSLEREIKLRNDLEINYMERFQKLESEKDQLNRDCVTHNVELGKLRLEFDALEREYGQYKATTEIQLQNLRKDNENLTQNLCEQTQKLERIDFLANRTQQTQTQLLLETEFEVKLFSLFSVYRDQHLVNGEFVMSEEQLISFCVDFGLGDSEPPAGNDGPRAKLAYNKVHEYTNDGRLNYALFKEFLMNLGLLLKPELTPSQAFRFVVFNLVTSAGNNMYYDEPAKDYHPVYVSEGNDPWASDPDTHQTLKDRFNHETGPRKFLDVEGKVWFNKASENVAAPNPDSALTPRFD